MSRYIDADKLIRKYIDTDIEKFSNSDVKIVLENLKQNILRAPSIDIVTCYMCKYSHMTYDGQCKYCDNITDDDGNVIEVYFDADHYCADGEREGE